VPILRINNITPQDMLHGVRQVVQTRIEQHHGSELDECFAKRCEDPMKRQYLHLCAYSCDKCRGPVVSASLGVRENDISKESQIRQIGAICLECGHRQNQATERLRARYLPPIEWGPSGAINAGDPRSAFVEARSIVQSYIEPGAVNLRTTIAVTETQFPEPVHEKIHSGTDGTYHLG